MKNYLPALFLLAGCSAVSDALSAVEELALSATTGAEESLLGGTMSPAAIPADERPDPFRECDASGAFEALFARYDADADGALDAPEEDEVHAARDHRDAEQERRVGAQWALLLAVYDTDGDAILSDTEQSVLFDDFTVRCETVQALLTAEYDADGDGVLSEAEMDTARAEMEAEMAENPHGPPPEGEAGDETGAGPHGPPPEGEPPAPGSVPPPLLEEFDADGDGALSEDERVTMQAAMRERIRAGDPLCGL